MKELEITSDPTIMIFGYSPNSRNKLKGFDERGKRFLEKLLVRDTVVLPFVTRFFALEDGQDEIDVLNEILEPVISSKPEFSLPQIFLAPDFLIERVRVKISDRDFPNLYLQNSGEYVADLIYSDTTTQIPRIENIKEK